MLSLIVDTVLEITGWILNLFGLPELQNYLDCRPSRELRFHHCGGLVSLRKNGSVVSRLDRNNFKDGIAFSHRAIEPNETVSVLVLKTTQKWVGPLAIGFTCYDPANLQDSDLRRIKACSRHPLGGFWIKSLLTHDMLPGRRISFSFNTTGQMKYSVDGVEQDDVVTGLPVQRPLWAVFDVYGTVQSIKLIRSKSGDINNNSEQSITYQDNLVPQQALVIPSPMFPFSVPREHTGLTPSWISRTFYSNFSDSPIQEQLQGIRNESIPLYRRRLGNLAPEFNLNCIGRRSSEIYQTPLEKFNSVKCVICLDKETTMTVESCGHMCLCHKCAQDFEQKSPRTFDWSGIPRLSCPVCRHPVSRILN